MKIVPTVFASIVIGVCGSAAFAENGNPPNTCEAFAGRLQASPVSFEDVETSVRSSICRSAALQGEYGRRSVRTGKWDKILQIPLVGVAAAGAHVVLRNSGSDAAGATKTLGQLGIATLAYTSVKNIILPSDRSPLFARGWMAMGCIVTEAPLFTGTAATTEHTAYESAVTTALTQLGIVEAKILAVQILPNVKPDLVPLLVTTKQTADTAVAQATPRLEEALGDLNAWKLRYQIFESARLAGEQRIESKLRLAASVDVSVLQAQMVAQGTPPSGGSQFESDQAVAAMTALANSVSQLAVEVNNVRGAARPYKARLELVAKCPEQI